MSEIVISRENCWKCNRALHLCFCSHILPFKFEPLIALLVHPKEYRKTVGTFRLVKLSIQNSVCWQGHGLDFDKNIEIGAIVSNPDFYPMILFPGEQSLNLSRLSEIEIHEKLPSNKKLVIFVIDGTWANARKMIRTSQILSSLPRLSFDVQTPSNYQFRKQPKPYCLSTVEAVHALIESLHEKGLCKLPSENAHDRMVSNFNLMVETQVRLQVGPVRY